jgi:hypothetical protein
VISWLWKLFPVGRLTAAWWAWRNRRELGRWLGFAWRAVPPSVADRGDVIAEARLRTAFARQARTRGVPSLTVRVHARTAFLGGSLAPEVHDLVYSIARSTTGVVRVECAIRDRGRRSTPDTHAHHDVAAALPPPPPEHHSARSIS